VVCVVRDTDLDEALNQVFAEVEIALGMPNTIFSGIARNITITLDNIDRPKLAQGEQPVAQAGMAYAVQYFAAENDPTAAA